MIDSRKLTKDFINYICNRMEYEHKEYNYDGFIESLRDKEAYAVKDKGIEKRIQKQLFKKLRLKSEVKYAYYPVGEGVIYIKLLKDEYYPCIQLPKLELKPFEGVLTRD